MLNGLNRSSLEDKITELNDLLKSGHLVKKQEVVVEEKKNTLVTVFTIIGVIVAIAAVVYALYRYFTPDYLEDFEDDFDDDFYDDFEDDFFEDEDTVTE